MLSVELCVGGDTVELEKTEHRRKVLIDLFYFAAVAALFYFVVRYALGWLMPFLIGFAVALIFRPVIYWMVDKLGFQRKFAAVLIVLLAYGVLGTGLTFGGIALASKLGDLFSGLPAFFNETIMPAFNNLGDYLERLFERLPPEWMSGLDAARDSLMSAITGAVTSFSRTGLNAVAGIAKGIPGFLIALVFTILASFFISQDYYGVTRFITAQLPDRVRKVLFEGKAAIASTLGAYAKAYAKIMLVTFIELTVGFLILGISNPLPKALGIAFFDILPVFGTGGIVIPWVIIDLLLGKFSRALGLLILYGVITVVRNFIEPKIVGDQLGLNPIVSIIAIYLGYRWFSVGGMILMPACVAMAITLHDKGVIHLYKDPGTVDEEAHRQRREALRAERKQRREATPLAARLRGVFRRKTK